MAGLNFLILILCYTGGGDKESSPSEEDNIPFLSKKRRSCPPRSCKKS